MKRILLLFGLFCSFSQVRAQYTSPNLGQKLTLNTLLQAGAITKTGNEYFVNQALTLDANDTLYIPTNETIKVGAGILLTIKGALIVNPPDSVKFTSSTTTNWHTLKFDNSTKVSKLDHTIIEKSSGVRVLTSALQMDSCIVRFNDRVNQSGAINVSGNQPVTVTNSKIYRNSRAAIMSPTNGASLVIRNNWIFENGVEPGNYPQINLGPASTSAPIIVTGNTIIGIDATTNNSGGIALSNLLGTANISTFLVEKNIIRKNRYGITITGGNIRGYIKRNTLEYNNVNPNVMTGGSGINFYNTSASQQVVAARNIIRYNSWGITIQSGTTVAAGPKPSLGRIGSTDTANVGMNQIYNNYNVGTSGQIWDLYNNTTDSIYAENNYWGTSNLTDIESHIFHKVDAAANGFVDFMPLMQATGITKENLSSALNLYPNPAQDVVKLTANGMLLTEKTTMKFYNMLGQEVLSIQPERAANYLEINTQKLKAGVYTYRIENNNAIATGKLIISK
jgi:hypothetical protein